MDMSDPSMCRFYCLPCGFVYDPKIGDPDACIPPGVAFSELPDNWICPVCGATKDMFELLDD